MSDNAPVTEAILKEALDPLHEAVAGVAVLVGKHDMKLEDIDQRLSEYNQRFEIIESGVGAILDHLTNGQAPAG